ncbi:MAG: hypothetical protein IT340_20070 [Chloroflexi bacterium]|nr:hypothetical protein [Chloroflexota bacterium]
MEGTALVDVLSEDTGRQVRGFWAVEGLVAAYALPYPPYAAGIPVLGLADFGDGALAGVVADGSDIVAADEADVGDFVTYYRLTDPAEVNQAVQARVVQAGQALQRAMMPQLQARRGGRAADSSLPDDDAGTYETTAPRRRRRRRTHAQPEEA